eukprot:403824_1
MDAFAAMPMKTRIYHLAIIFMLGLLTTMFRMIEHNHYSQPVLTDEITLTHITHNSYNATKICSLLLRKYIMMRHHKTGYDLGTHIQDDICAFCKMNTSLNKILLETWEPLIRMEYKEDVTYFHFTRAPVDTIISGYFYHKTTNDPREDWAYAPTIKNAISDRSTRINRGLYRDIVNNNVNSFHFYKQYMKNWNIPFTKLSQCFELDYIQNVINTTNIDLGSLNTNISLQNFYKLLYSSTNNHTMGLWWEFLRYFNCEWSGIFVAEKIGKKKYFNNYIEFKLNEFSTHKGYDRNINMILDGINFIDNTENNKLLNEQRINVNISDLRNYLFQILQKHYIQRNNNAYISKNEKKHITRNMYDKPKIVKQLLELDKNSCLIIKNMTLYIDQQWIYGVYC